jgi:hypothetical protein
MSTPKLTHDTAKAIYEYAGTDGLPAYSDLAPTIQISYIEEAEAALSCIGEYIRKLGSEVELDSDDAYIVKGVVLSIAHILDPKQPELEAEDDDSDNDDDE